MQRIMIMKWAWMQYSFQANLKALGRLCTYSEECYRNGKLWIWEEGDVMHERARSAWRGTQNTIKDVPCARNFAWRMMMRRKIFIKSISGFPRQTIFLLAWTRNLALQVYARKFDLLNAVCNLHQLREFIAGRVESCRELRGPMTVRSQNRQIRIVR